MLCTIKSFFYRSTFILFLLFIYLIIYYFLIYKLHIAYLTNRISLLIRWLQCCLILMIYLKLSSHNKLYFRKRHEAEQSESYETWLANKETEKKTVTLAPVPPSIPGPSVAPKPVEMNTSERSQEPERADGYLRTYLRSLDDRKRGNSYFCYEQWLDEKEETVLGLQRQKTAMAWRVDLICAFMSYIYVHCICASYIYKSHILVCIVFL